MLQDFDGDYCAWCERRINLFPLESFTDEIFCDIACAKLYSDNTTTIKINLKKYNIQYVNNRLDEKAKYIYNIISGALFETLPIYKVSDESHYEAKCNYYALLKSIYTCS